MKLFDVVTMLAGFIGLALVSFGAWMLLPAAGFITGGIGLVGWSYYASKSAGP